MKESEVVSPLISKTAETKAPKSRLRRSLKIGAILAFLLVAAVLSLPYLLPAYRQQVEEELSAALGTEVKIESYYFDWFRGVGLRGFEVANPEGFSDTEKLFAMRSFEGDVGFLSILRGAPEITGRIEGLELRLVQKADGTTNIGELLNLTASATVESKTPEPKTPNQEPPFDWSQIQIVPEGLEDLRLDLELSNSLIEIRHEVNGVLERLEGVEVRLTKEYGSTVVQLSFEADLNRPDKPNNPGRITTRASFNPAADNPVDAKLVCNDIDLSRYRPILETMLEPGQVEAFAGIVTGNWTARLSREGFLTSSGKLDIEAPHFKGPLFGDMNIAADRWSIQPDLTVDLKELENPTFQFENFTTDLGFARITGLSPENANKILKGAVLGLEFDADLDKLASFGGPIPAELRGSRGKTQGKLALPKLDLKNLDPKALLASVHLEVDTIATRLAYEMAEITDLKSMLSLKGGIAALKIDSSTQLNGGPFALDASFDLTQLDTLPTKFRLQVTGSKAQAETVELLRYVVPLLSGLTESTGLDFSSNLDLTLELSGLAQMGENQSMLQWLEGWTGTGSVGMNQAKFTPASTFGQLFTLAASSLKPGEKDKGQVSVDDLSTNFVMKNGYIETGLMKFESQGREYGLKGRTKMSGEIEYSIDATALLKGHGDGAKVLAYLPENALTAQLTGTVDSPSLDMPDLKDLFAKAAKAAATKAAGNEAQKAIDKVLDKNVDEKTKGQINNLLNGLFGGKKKK